MIYVLSGIQCAGKTSYALNFLNKAKKTYPIRFPLIVSKDTIRLKLFGKYYKQNSKDEQEVEKEFYEILDEYAAHSNRNNFDLIIDNTNCKEKYLDEIIGNYHDIKIKIIFFNTPLWLAYYRNVIRYYKTEKWIPFKVIKQFKKNFDKINKDKYKKYV